MSGLTAKAKARRDLALRALKASRELFPGGSDKEVNEGAVTIALTVLGQDISLKDIANAKKLGADISDKPRRFQVWLDRNVVGCEIIEEYVDVEPGQDANRVCGDWLDVLTSNEIDSGWQEVSP